MASGIFPLTFYCQKVLPAVFDDSLSYYEAVCKLRDKVNELIEAYGPESDTITQLVETVNELNELLDEIKDGRYADLYLQQLEAYIDANLQNLVARIAYYVFPTLVYDDARKVWRYAIAVPSSWDWLRFQWTWDPERLAWRLSLKY